MSHMRGLRLIQSAVSLSNRAFPPPSEKTKKFQRVQVLEHRSCWCLDERTRFSILFISSIFLSQRLGRWVWRFPVGRDTHFGSAKVVADNRLLVNFLRNSGGMKKKEGWVVIDWTLHELVYGLTDLFPNLFEFGTWPKVMQECSLFFLASPAAVWC